MIILRHIQKSDYRCLKSYITDSRATKFLTWKPYKNEKRIKDFLNLSINLNKYPNEFLGIICKKKLIGTIHLIARDNKKVQFGFGIMSKFWGKGYGSQIIKQSILYIKKSIWGLYNNEIIIDIHKDNVFAERVVEKNGFIKICRQPKNFKDRYRYLCPIKK